MTKYICIGFQKTGTTTMGAALRTLGFHVAGYELQRQLDNDESLHPLTVEKIVPLARDVLDSADVFEDNPWPLVYQQVDQAVPGMKYILTIRDADAWYQSHLRHFGGWRTKINDFIYGNGDPKGQEEQFKARYKAHNLEAQAYFRDRPQDFLVFDMAKGDGWQKLCAFTGKPVPPEPFPHKNSSRKRERKLSWKFKRLKRWLGLSS